MVGSPGLAAVIAAGAFALIGAVFGALARLNTTAGGGRAGRAVAELLGSVREPTRRAVAGGVDGALFLGFLGFFVGLCIGMEGIPNVVLGLAVLAGAAILFGWFLVNLIRGTWPILGMILGAMSSAALMASLSSDPLAIVATAAGGLAAGWVLYSTRSD
jgi:hypothetical protein